MEVLWVYSENSGRMAPFLKEQADSLTKMGVAITYFGLTKRGILGYLLEVKRLRRYLKINDFDLIHAHYGLSGLVAVLQNSIPVITTFHGCDVNRLKLRILSWIPFLRSYKNIFVSKRQERLFYGLKKGKSYIIPCGINFDQFQPLEKVVARKKLNLPIDKFLVLFSSAFDIPVKNSKLAKDALEILGEEYILLELKGYSREQVVELMSASDIGLLTSLREGSPMFIKEMMALNKPVVSTDVGDVRERFGSLNGYFLTSNDPFEIADAIKKTLTFQVTSGRDNILYLDNEKIAKRISQLYQEVI